MKNANFNLKNNHNKGETMTYNNHSITELTQEELFELIDIIRDELENDGYDSFVSAPTDIKIEVQQIVQEFNRRAKIVSDGFLDAITINQLFFE